MRLLLLAALLTSGCAAPRPQIAVWHGPQQTFGTNGTPQHWINVVGRIEPVEAVEAATFTVGSAERRLKIGPTDRRLAEPGDFNIEIDRRKLEPGTHEVIIEAHNPSGARVRAKVALIVEQRAPPALPHGIAWQTAAQPWELVEIIDGQWRRTPDGLRTSQVAYDRIFAVGDVTWTDLEILVPITVHAIDQKGFRYPSIAPGIGIIPRWQGHTDRPVACGRPHCGWEPSGAMAWYGFGNTRKPLKIGDHARAPFDLELGRTYWWRFRLATIDHHRTAYGLKVWPADGVEPTDWLLSIAAPHGLARHGSLLLVAHHVDATFGNIEIVPVAGTDGLEVDSRTLRPWRTRGQPRILQRPTPATE